MVLNKMWPANGKGNGLGKKAGRNGLVAIAIDKDKNSQHALKWAIDNILTKGQTLILIHVLNKSSTESYDNNYALRDLNGIATNRQGLDKHTKELFLTFHCFCIRKDIHCFDVILEDIDTAKAITEYCAHAAIENLVLGASRHGFISKETGLMDGRFLWRERLLNVVHVGFVRCYGGDHWPPITCFHVIETVDISSVVCKAASDFCTVYVISKSKISSIRNASRIAPFTSPLLNRIQQMQIQDQANSNAYANANSNTNDSNMSPDIRSSQSPSQSPSMRGMELLTPRKYVDDPDAVSSPFSRGRGYNGIKFMDFSESDTDISFISSDRPSTDRPSTDRMSYYIDGMDAGRFGRLSCSSESDFGSMRSSTTFTTEYSSSSVEIDDVGAEMRRLKLELQKTMEMYSTACKEALTAKQKAVELHRWRIEEERRLEEARVAEESARLNAEQEKAKYKAALENAHAAQRNAEIESEKRVSEIKSMQESNENNKEMSGTISSLRYRRYSIEEIEEATQYFSESHKIGEGSYGPVYRCYLDHTPAAVKVLRPDAAQGKVQFQQEIEVLSCMRHPNMVLLLGACPEYGCLVYEYMANGSLDDRLLRRGKTRPLSWQLRFQIASEIATCLHFLHQTKPEPLVHRDLKPGNILLDQNYVSKIGDVGLSRLVPPTVADNVTQFRMTSTAGTFCYIDPEYQQTGMLGVKSDVYSFGIVLLQIITAKPAMGLSHYVRQAIENETLAELLDPAVMDWPVEETLAFAKLAVQCSELRRKDRPDLGKVILPELNRLREFGEEKMEHILVGGGSAAPSPNHSFVPMRKEFKSESHIHIKFCSPLQKCSSTASLPEKLSEETI